MRGCVGVARMRTTVSHVSADKFQSARSVSLLSVGPYIQSVVVGNLSVRKEKLFSVECVH